MGKTKVAMPEQDPKLRNKNFKEVALGYSLQDAMTEAKRCIQCKNPKCKAGCPVEVPIPEFIKCVAEGDIEAAYRIIKSTNSLPAVCGRVCPQEEQCEKTCVVGIKNEPVGIGRLERFVADWARENGIEEKVEIEKKPFKAVVIGAGPAGLTCAGDLAKMGVDVTVYEAFHKPGGVLMYGIPEFRLPKELVAQEIKSLEDMGVKFVYDVIVGRTIDVEHLLADFDSVFIGSGAGLPRFMNIDGEELIGVYSANEYLTRINLMQAYKPDSHTPVLKSKKAAIVGGGNVAMDAARCAKRMGADVHVVYRRSMEELPARKEEVHHAIEEEIEFDLLCNPVEILGEDGKVIGMRCVKMELGEPDDSGRRRPVVIEGSEFVLDVDMVVMSIGTSPNPLIRRTTKGLETQSWGGLIVDEQTMKTSIDGVYAGGDTVTGAATVILAMGAGKTAAKAMYEYMTNK